MNKHLALAYGFAGLAVAAVVVTFVSTSTNALDPTEVAVVAPEAAAPDPTPATPALAETPATTEAASTAPEATVDYVYVDEPARGGGRHDDEGDDDDEHERNEGRDDDDDHHERGDDRDHDD